MWGDLSDERKRLSFGTAVDLRQRRPEFESRQGENFHFSISSIPATGPTQLPTQLVSVILRVRQQERVANHISTSTDVNKIRLYTYAPHTPSWCSY
jgi:hypothetical protein